MIPYSRAKGSDLYTLSYSKLLKNHTLHSGTYLYSPYMAVPPPPPVGSFSNDDGDGNEDVKKAIGNVYTVAKQQLCTCITLFCTFLYRPCTTKWKCLTASFMEEVNKQRRISFSLSKLDCGPQEINSGEIRLHLPFSANWNKRDKDWKNGNSF